MKKKTKNILVCDEGEILIKLVKHYCGSNIDVTFCNKFDMIFNLELNTYGHAFVIANKIAHLDFLLKIKQDIPNLYVNTNSIHVKEKLQITKGVFLFDLKRDRVKIMTKIFEETIN